LDGAAALVVFLVLGCFFFFFVGALAPGLFLLRVLVLVVFDGAGRATGRCDDKGGGGVLPRGALGVAPKSSVDVGS